MQYISKKKYDRIIYYIMQNSMFFDLWIEIFVWVLSLFDYK